MSFDPKHYWETRLAADFTLQGVGYHRLGANFNRWMYRLRRSVFARAAASIRDDWSGARVLDIGSGTGFYLDAWRRAGADHLTGCDLTSAAVERLRMQFADIPVVQADIGAERLPQGLAPESFDAISIFDVLFHIVDDEAFARALQNIAALLKPGGVCLLSDNFLHRPPAAATADHVAGRTLEQYELALREAGLHVVERRPMFVLMNQPVDEPSAAMRLWWRGLSAVASRSDALGGVIGAMLYPLEAALVASKRESPTTELMICRKGGAA